MSAIYPFVMGWYQGFLGQMVFTYFIIYVTLPGYFRRKKIKIFTTLITLFFVGVYAVWQYLTLYSHYAAAVKRGQRPFVPDMSYILAVEIKWITFGLPTIVGLAVSIKLVKHWWLKQKETEQIAREKATAELQLLKAQIHPHFLFNTLNNIYFFTLSTSRQAPEMIKKLSDILRYILNECDQPLVPLQKEIRMIQDYMALEKIRYGEQMEMSIEIKGNDQGKMITPLLLIPFIENSFKHGASRMLNHPYVRLNISIEDKNLIFLLTNSKPDLPAAPVKNGSIGLKNVRKRLQLLYPGTHELNIVNESETFFVFLKIQLRDITDTLITSGERQKKSYAMA